MTVSDGLTYDDAGQIEDFAGRCERIARTCRTALAFKVNQPAAEMLQDVATRAEGLAESLKTLAKWIEDNAGH